VPCVTHHIAQHEAAARLVAVRDRERREKGSSNRKFAQPETLALTA
jgi:hypothetical protein